MVALQYKGRIHKSKLSVRSLRYIAADQLARAFPALQERWLLPVEESAIGDAAYAVQRCPSVTVEAALPDELLGFKIRHPDPMRIEHCVYSLRDVTVTGWAGAMIRDGRLLTIRPNHNWVSALRPRPHETRVISGEMTYINLMAPMTARGHIFHWLYDSIIPLLSYLSQDERPEKIGLIVNARRTEIQDRTLAFVRDQFGIASVEGVGENEAVRVPDLRAIVPVPNTPRGLQSRNGLSYAPALAQFLAAGSQGPAARRIYISRNDARLRRVANEDDIMANLTGAGFTRVILKGRPLAEQVSLFLNAEAVVAPHGAGLAHLTWCRPGTKVVEIFPSPAGGNRRRRDVSSDYWIISQMLSLNYSAYLADPILNRANDFTVGVAKLSRHLQDNGITSP